MFMISGIQEYRELRDIQPQMKGFKRLSLAQMPEAKSTQRCLHVLAVSWELSWLSPIFTWGQSPDLVKIKYTSANESYLKLLQACALLSTDK